MICAMLHGHPEPLIAFLLFEGKKEMIASQSLNGGDDARCETLRL